MTSCVKQYFAVICANLMTFNYGITVGWPSSTLPLLMSDETPLASGALTLFQVSCIGSILCIGGALGQMLYAWIADKYGRKPGMMMTFVPAVIHWLLIEFGTEFYALLVARFLAGITAGGVFQVIPMIVSEISSIEIRGRLGSFIMLFTNAGTVFAYIVCNYTSYFAVPWISIGICTMFLVGYSFMHETPKYLMMIKKEKEALDAMRFFNNGPFTDSKSAEILKSEGFDVEKDEIRVKCTSLKLDRAAKRGFIIGNVLVNIVIFSGLFTFANYYDMIFREAGSSLSPALSSIIVGSIQLAGTISASTVVERVGRKPLILVSAYGSAFFVTIMGLHSMLMDVGVDVSSFSWVPLICLSLLVFVAANGAQSLPMVIVGEIFAQEVRGPLISLCLIGNWTMSFILLLVFPYMVEYLKIYGAIWVFAVIECALATVILVMLPETKGVSIERIVQILGKGK
ncbi:facilitated trehalose transporter Tret1-like [Culicoides brevitarsis]|uniref:facilitated trehalose transporter Tret1-like n=1 Tax=Culicoides brevitarsis TaxID=469753 RepID=UPI00307BE90B